MTEQEIIYSLLETIRNSEINDDERMTEAYLRNILYTYRADALKGMHDVSEEVFQEFSLKTVLEQNSSGIFHSTNLPDIIYDVSRYGILIYDLYGTELPVTSKEEAVNSQKRRFYTPKYIAFIQAGKLTIQANLKLLETSGDIENSLLNLLNTNDSVIKISCVLTDPSKGDGYNWRESNFPFPSVKTNTLKQNILRREFGIMYEVKKDEIQNARADNIIYQDESKLYK